MKLITELVCMTLAHSATLVAKAFNSSDILSNDSRLRTVPTQPADRSLQELTEFQSFFFTSMSSFTFASAYTTVRSGT
jgi:hypothetical protein